MEPKRRLPLVSPARADGAEEAADRAPWQWVGFGALAIFVVWLPLAWASSMVALRLGWLAGAPLLAMAVAAGGLALAALAGGYLIGRFATGAIGVREAALAGLTTGIVATMGVWGAGTSSPFALITVIVATPPAALGGWLGCRRRARGVQARTLH